jgi:predicted enzyme related to lactoylglutathione lyase
MTSGRPPGPGPRLADTGEFCWMDLKTRDLPGTAAVLSDLLGWQFAEDPADWRRATVISVGGYRIGTVSDLAAPIYPEGTPPHLAFYLAVDDADLRSAAAADHGAEIVVAPFDAADQGRIATLIDPFGAVVSLWQPAPGHGWRHPIGLRNAPYRMRLTSSQPEQARRFYRDTLGAHLCHADIVAAPHGAAPGQWHLTISADIHDIAHRTALQQARTPAPPHDGGLLPIRTREAITIYATTPPPPDSETPAQ